MTDPSKTVSPAVSLSRWNRRFPATGEAFKLLVVIEIAVLFVYDILRLVFSDIGFNGQVPNDFFVFWSWGAFASSHPVSAIYSPDAVHAFQVSLGMDPTIYAPYPYPPVFIFLLMLLAHLPLLHAWALWGSGTLTAYLLSLLYQDRGRYLTLATLILPTTALGIISGQNGFLTAALVIGGFALSRTRPVIAGVLIGLLILKPQMAILIPFALASAGLWRMFASAALTVAAVIVTVGMTAGWGLWAAWILALGKFSGSSDSFAAFQYLMPTVIAEMKMIGAGPGTAGAVQMLSCAAMIFVILRCFRKGVGVLPVAALFVATFLATPYAFVYDLPLAGTALVVVVAEAVATGGSFTLFEVLIMLLFAFMPVTLTMPTSHIPFGALSCALFLAMIVGRIRAKAAAVPAVS